MSRNNTFIDQVKIFVQAGSGGDGHVGFFRAKFIPHGGPDGGDGGKGGDVVFVGSFHKSTLQDFRFKKHFRAKNGAKGGRAQRTGADGETLEIRVPLGTIIFEESGEKILGEVTKEGERFILEEGGKGGLGNLHFVSSINRTPRKATPGVKREGKWIRLELRLLADVGIVGLPNAGKSTLLSTVTEAKPKIADYPFTTLAPSLGVISHGKKTWTMADMPGLIEGAHKGVGLGVQFLKHIQRTRLLLYVVAANPENPLQSWIDYKTTREEIAQYDPALAERPFLVAVNKTDLLTPGLLEETAQYFRKKGVTLIPISAKQKTGLDPLVKALHDKLD